MNGKTLWNERLGLLAASASPGSALAYHLGLTTLRARMMRRNTTTRAESDLCAAASPERALSRGGERQVPLLARRVWRWLASAVDRLEERSWQRELRERERYLAQSENLVDLEARMRALDGDPFFSRARALR